MSSIVLVYQKTPTTLDSITVDATLSETPQYESETTDHPVEVGFNITDHVRPQPTVLTLECIISNTSIVTKDTVGRDAANQQGIQAIRSGGAAVTQDPTVDAGSIVRIAFEQLKNIRDTGKLISVNSRFQQYNNMVIKSLSFPREPANGDLLRFSITLKEIKIVQNKTVKAAQQTSKKPAANPKSSKGNTQPNKPADPPKVRQSLLKTLVGSSKSAA